MTNTEKIVKCITDAIDTSASEINDLIVGEVLVALDIVRENMANSGLYFLIEELWDERVKTLDGLGSDSFDKTKV